MFESIRKHSKIAMLVMFLLIIPSFVLVGIDSQYFSGSSPVVARVDGQDITQAEWDNAHRIESDRMRTQQPGIDGALLDSPQARYGTLERMVRDRVLQAAANKFHLQPSNARLASALQEIPEIAALRRPDGSLDAEAYRKLVATQGLTPEGFESRMRYDLAVNQVLGAVVNSSFATPAQADVTLAPLFQQREIRVAYFKPKDFAAKVQVSDADLETYYKESADQFKEPERADVEYVVLDLDAVRAGITLNEDDLKTYYKENLTQFAGKEERRASHILIAAAKDAPAAQRAAAKARADELLAQVRKAPETFAEVAKKNSQDQGSAGQG
ncbi:MAG: peptidylprolyl isomerase, partial [Giesbergeria sp.]